MKTNKNFEFNIVIVGTGGQGLLTLLEILSDAALNKGYDVKTSELHGLSQRGGSVEVHIRFGEEIFSPLVPQTKANLILALETQETLKASYFANPETVFLINKYLIPISDQKVVSEDEILKVLKKLSKNIFLVPANEICKKELGNEVVAGVYLLGLAVLKNLLPLKSDTILKAIKNKIPEKYLELNLKAFNLSKTTQSLNPSTV